MWRAVAASADPAVSSAAPRLRHRAWRGRVARPPFRLASDAAAHRGAAGRGVERAQADANDEREAGAPGPSSHDGMSRHARLGYPRCREAMATARHRVRVPTNDGVASTPARFAVAPARDAMGHLATTSAVSARRRWPTTPWPSVVVSATIPATITVPAPVATTRDPSMGALSAPPLPCSCPRLCPRWRSHHGRDRDRDLVPIAPRPRTRAHVRDLYGIRLENLLLVQPGAAKPFLRFETLTLAPFDWRLIDPALLDAAELAWLDAHHARVAAEVGPGLDAAARLWLDAACAPPGAQRIVRATLRSAQPSWPVP